MDKFIAIGFGGFIGSICRYWLSLNIYKIAGDEFPYGTLIVNLLGCFTIGLLMTIFEDRFSVQPNLRLFITNRADEIG
jgi:uncharacterized protein